MIQEKVSSNKEGKSKASLLFSFLFSIDRPSLLSHFCIQQTLAVLSYLGEMRVNKHVPVARTCGFRVLGCAK